MLAYRNFNDIPHPCRVRLSFNKVSENINLAACPSSSNLIFTVSLARALCASDVRLRILCDDDGTESFFTVSPESCDREYDVFSVTLTTSALCKSDGLFFFLYDFMTPYGRLCTDGDWSSDTPRLSQSGDNTARYQLTVYRKGEVRRAAMAGGTMYQIMVDRFSRSEEKGVICDRDDVVMCDDWYDDITQYPEYPGAFVKNNLFFGGSLWGVLEKLDYLASLSVDTLYLCPIFEAYSNHKYDTGDYMKVDSMFGGDEALDELLAGCRERGMRVVLDGVFNHTGSISRYFNADGRYNDVGAYQSKESPYYDWYTFTSFPDEYRCWWGIKILPAVRGDSLSWRQFITGPLGVVDTYIRKGVSGFRLDVVDELQEDFLKALTSRAKSENKDAFIIGEVWEDASNKIAYNSRRRYFRGGELDSAMNYPLKNAIIDFVLRGDAEAFAASVTQLYTHYPKDVSDSMMNMLGTHDTERILTVFSCENCSEMTNEELSHLRMSDVARKLAKERLMCAYSILATMPGVPCIYYGDEAGMEGARDPFNRKGYPWGREDCDLLDFFRRIGRMRKENRTLFASGLFRVIYAHCGVVIFIRSGRFDVAVVANCGGQEYTLHTGGRAERLDTGEVLPESVAVRPMQTVIIKLKGR